MDNKVVHDLTMTYLNSNFNNFSSVEELFNNYINTREKFSNLLDTYNKSLKSDINEYIELMDKFI